MLTQSAVCVCVYVEIKVKRQGTLTPALHGAVCASASGSTEYRDLLTSQALLVSQASLDRQQAFVAPCANAAVIRILLGCQNWILQLLTFATYTSQQKVSLFMPLALWQAMNLETCFTPVVLQNSCALVQHLRCAASTLHGEELELRQLCW